MVERPGERIDDLHHHDIPAASEHLPPLRRALAEWARRVGVDELGVEAIVLAAYEAAANAVEHAYPAGGGVLSLSARHLQNPSRVEVTVADRGTWRQRTTDPAPGVALRGRGIPLIRQLADAVTLDTGEEGTVVRATWELDENGGARPPTPPGGPGGREPT